jgi:oligoendopeptidase F
MTLDQDPVARFRLLARQLDDAIATVFRQVAIHRFEDAVHRERRALGELSVDRIGELWISANQEMFGDTVELTDSYRSWWSYISHVFSSPGYVYAYAYGQLMALSIYGRYVEQGEPFVARYLELLAAGGSRSPEQLAQIVGIDLGDPGFWETGLGFIDQRLAEAEAAASQVGS